MGEELVNAVTHGIGAVFGAVATALMMIKTVPIGGIKKIVCAFVFGLSMIILYTMSCLYHSLKVNNGKRVLRVIDHCTIFLLIAGTYTPFTLIGLGGSTGWTLFSIVWVSAIAGTIFNSIDLHKFRYLSMAAYIMTGWVIIFAWDELVSSMDMVGVVLLFAGGISYTIGAILYGVGKKLKYMHSVFHVFVLGGSVLHFLSVYNYIL